MFTSGNLSKFLLITMIVGLVACANNPLNSPMSNTVNVQQLVGTPLPSKTHIESDSSLIFGDGESWSGRVEAAVPLKADDAVKFFIDQYPSSGWTLLSSARSKVSIIVFANKIKTVTIEITDASGFGGGSKVTLTAAPLHSLGK